MSTELQSRLGQLINLSGAGVPDAVHPAAVPSVPSVAPVPVPPVIPTLSARPTGSLSYAAKPTKPTKPGGPSVWYLVAALTLGVGLGLAIGLLCWNQNKCKANKTQDKGRAH